MISIIFVSVDILSGPKGHKVSRKTSQRLDLVEIQTHSSFQIKFHNMPRMYAMAYVCNCVNMT